MSSPLGEICDVCGTILDDEAALYAVVPDSSVVHASNPKFDGRRLISVCGQDHLRELVDEYHRRPFVDAELWAGKIERALDSHPDHRLTEDAVIAATGLTAGQVREGVAWQNSHPRERGPSG